MNIKSILHSFTAGLFVLFFASNLLAETDTPTPEDRSYKLSRLDLVQLSVFGEPDVETLQRIDGSGRIRIPLVGSYEITGKTIRDAEEAIEKLYVSEQIFRHPLVTIQIEEYSPKEVSVHGEVRNPGIIEFNIEVSEMDIVEVISRAGGFTQISRSNRVQVTRIHEDGTEEVSELDVERMIRGNRRSSGNGQNTFAIQPGDIIFVPQSIF